MSTALSTLAASLQAQMNWQVTLTSTGLAAKQDQETPNKKFTFSLGTGLGSCNEVVVRYDDITTSGSLSIDLTSQTDVCGQAVNFSAIKGIFIWLLATGDTALDGVTVGTACSGIIIDNTVVNALSAQSHSGWFDNGSEGGVGGSKFTIPNGAVLPFAIPSAGGLVVDGTHKIIKLTNLDAGVHAHVQTVLFGNG